MHCRHFVLPLFLGPKVWVFYSLASYSGDSVALTEGVYNDLGTQLDPIGPDAVSSVQVFGKLLD